MQGLGIFCGFTTAILMACSYIASGWAIRRTPELNALTLLACSFIWMGLVCVVGLAFTWRPEILQGFWHRFPPVVASLSCYTLAQILMFAAQRKVDASLLVPLLGLKLPILMFLNIAFLGSSFTWLQVFAVALTVVAAFLLNRTGKGLVFSSLCYVLLACVFFSLSDMSLKQETDLLINELGFSPTLAAAYCTYLNYLTAGIFGAVVIAFNRRIRTRRAMLHSLPYGLLWIVSIIFLNICFAILGTVNGNIIQSTRGIFAILFAPILVACGLTYLEQKVSVGTIARRLLAAGLMVGAIFLYNFRQGSSHTPPTVSPLNTESISQ